MEADFVVELGPDDEVLDFPWADPENRWRYYDLKHQPELLLNVAEAHEFPELESFLLAANSPSAKLESAKCDAWFTTEMNVEDVIFGESGKFGSYVDLVFSDDGDRYSFESHEKLARKLVELLKLVPEIPCAAEFLIRRCYYRRQDEPMSGFYITFYLFGYGDDEAQARKRWAIGLKLVENIILQLSMRH
jgi:hypothetical protein